LSDFWLVRIDPSGTVGGGIPSGESGEIPREDDQAAYLLMSAIVVGVIVLVWILSKRI
jgi:hypothetical protein